MNDGGVISRITSDSDALLILALIYILYKQNADRSLILALLFILVG